MLKVALYHGSTHSEGIKEVRIDLPNDPLCVARKTMDFGQGFYLTPRIQQAREWAVRYGKNGSLNFFTLDLDGLNILNLDPKETSPLYWIGEIIYNRRFEDISKKNYVWIEKYWKINTDGYDVILGYTADDQCFSMFNDFLKNRLSFHGLCKALLLVDLGYQYVVRSKKAYEHLKIIRESQIIYRNMFEPLLFRRKNNAKINYELIRKEYEDISSKEIYFKNILENEIMPNDPLVAFPFPDIRNDQRIDNAILDETETLNQTRNTDKPIFPGFTPLQ
ncbi:MAG: DUF3990 domain-containing protein [Desulfovibrionaceae bacterium]|nr:DUF3990 domain-containing protein [Desulfovibrionaceae bacterium]